MRKFIFRDNHHEPGKFDIGYLPEIDKTRKTAVYIRQSGDGADTEHGESRETQLALIDLAKKIRREDDLDGVLVYDEGAGKSGQKRIDERPKLQQLWDDMEAGLIGCIVVAKEDRLFRNKHLDQVSTFTQKAERLGIVVIVPPLSAKHALRYYDFRVYAHLRAFQDKMLTAYDYIEYHVGYMHLNQRNKAGRGCYDGRSLPPGLAIPKWVDKSERRPVIYEPWAQIMRDCWRRVKELNWSFNRLVRDLEAKPYVFPKPSEEDLARYIFKHNMRPVSGGYKPHAKAIKAWFENIALMGAWVVDQETGETISNNHPAIIEREEFELGYIQRTGYTLDGIEVPEVRKERRFQERRSRMEPPCLVLRYRITCPQATYISVRTWKSIDYYVGQRLEEGKLYIDNVFTISGPGLDTIVKERLQSLSEADSHMAARIQENLEEVQKSQLQACSSIDEQLTTIAQQLKRARARLNNIEMDLDDETIAELKGKVTDLVTRQTDLQNKRDRIARIKGPEQVANFYEVLRNFREKYDGLSLEEKQRLIELLTTTIELELVSPHWFKLTIEWIGPVSVRPDVCLIWKRIPIKGKPLSEEEMEIIRLYYPMCERYTDLLRLMPVRTWYSIATWASNRVHVAVDPTLVRRRIADFPVTLTWADSQAILKMQKNPQPDLCIKLAEMAMAYCETNESEFCSFWAWDADIVTQEEDIKALLGQGLEINISEEPG